MESSGHGHVDALVVAAEHPGFGVEAERDVGLLERCGKPRREAARVEGELAGDERRLDQRIVEQVGRN